MAHWHSEVVKLHRLTIAFNSTNLISVVAYTFRSDIAHAHFVDSENMTRTTILFQERGSPQILHFPSKIIPVLTRTY